MAVRYPVMSSEVKSPQHPPGSHPSRERSIPRAYAIRGPLFPPRSHRAESCARTGSSWTGFEFFEDGAEDEHIQGNRCALKALTRAMLFEIELDP